MAVKFIRNDKKQNNMSKKVLLMILDGWGEGKHDWTNAIYTQGAPYIDSLRAKYPHSHLQACGEAVGLPEGQMGNSEVGHLNLGAGRVVYQDLVKINMACREHKLLENPEIKAAYDYVAARERNSILWDLCQRAAYILRRSTSMSSSLLQRSMG